MQLELVDVTKNLNENLTVSEHAKSLWIRYGIFFPIFLVTVISNLLVIIVVFRDKRLRTPSNYLIASLAFTDFFAGCILPLEFLSIGVASVWPFSPQWCQLRYASVIFCTISSTHHLLIISIDRYYFVTSLKYSMLRTTKCMIGIIAIVWLESIVISLSPVFGWHNPRFFELISTSACFVVIDFRLQLFVGILTFYIPFPIMLLVYWKIFQASKLL